MLLLRVEVMLRSCLIILGSFFNQFWIIVGTFLNQGHFGIFVESISGRVVVIQGSFRRQFWVILGSCLGHFEDILESFLNHFGINFEVSLESFFLEIRPKQAPLRIRRNYIDD